MTLNWLEKIGDWNPQLWREVKGHLKPRNVIIPVAISLVGQCLLFVYFYSQLPVDKIENDVYSRYCTGSGSYSKRCLKDAAGNLVINWSLWWHDLFIVLSLISIFALLAAGTYMLISDLSKEERRSTLNFIRLSPRSAVSILTGKLLGVPILLYLVAVLAVPLHLWAGLSAQISLAKIFSFYGILTASCIFFYSGALLCSTVSAERGEALAWLSAGAVLVFLWLTMALAMSWVPLNSPSTWLRMLSPLDSTFHLFPSSEGDLQGLLGLQWYYLPIGASVASLVGFTLLNYGLWTYWIWQALRRCFRNPNGTILSKRQSYLLVACFEVMLLGFVAQGQEAYAFSNSLAGVILFNLLLLFGLIAILSPHRQALIDWARYRREGGSQRKGFWNRALVQDLIWDEKSPAVVAMAINLAIATTLVALWILLVLPKSGDLSSGSGDEIKGLFAVAFFVSLMLIYATIAQLMLLIQTKKRSPWPAGTVGAAIFLPPLFLGMSGINPYENPTPWLFSTFPWVGIEHAATTTIFMALLSEWGVLVLLNLQLTRQLRRAGESASKALFANRPSLPAG
jgi:hypothetical protein